MLEIHAVTTLTITADNKNAYLKGLFKPNAVEYNANTESLKVIGEIPVDLNGVYVRNTHNQIHEPMSHYHPFDGDGMLHSAYFKNGKMALIFVKKYFKLVVCVSVIVSINSRPLSSINFFRKNFEK